MALGSSSSQRRDRYGASKVRVVALRGLCRFSVEGRSGSLERCRQGSWPFEVTATLESRPLVEWSHAPSCQSRDLERKDIPPELRELPAGRYVVEAVDEIAPALSPEEEGGIEAASIVPTGTRD